MPLKANVDLAFGKSSTVKQASSTAPGCEVRWQAGRDFCGTT